MRTSSNDPETYGLLGIYDVMDPAAVWGNRSRFWQDIGRISWDVKKTANKCATYQLRLVVYPMLSRMLFISVLHREKPQRQRCFWIDFTLCFAWFWVAEILMKLSLDSVDRWKRNQSWPCFATNRWPCSSSSRRAHGREQDLIRPGDDDCGLIWLTSNKKNDGVTHSNTHTHTLILCGWYKNIDFVY